MSEPRKNHLNIDGAQPKEEAHVDSYKPLSETTDQEFRSSKSSIGKSKEKVSDPAEEKLLNKEDEVKIAPMSTEAKYDHRNGDTKIELDAAKKQSSGLTKEELMKYADDPFWVRLRWFMFVLFWALWLAMLAGAIAIIVRAPKCAPPPPKTWYEIGPLLDHSDAVVNYEALEAELPVLEKAKVQGIFINPCEETYKVLDDKTCVDNFKKFLEKVKDKSIKYIVDLTANFVSTNHTWFLQSENRSEEFDKYFTWNKSSEFGEDNKPKVPNNWVSYKNDGNFAWGWSDKRQEYYLQQFGSGVADLNFHNQAVVKRFDEVLKIWVDAGVSGVRLRKARQLLVDENQEDEEMDTKYKDAAFKQYNFYKHKHSADHPELANLLAHFAQVTTNGGDNVFTIHEDGVLKTEWYLYRNASLLRPPSAAPLVLPPHDLKAFAALLDNTAKHWPATQLTAAEPVNNAELAKLTMLLPLTPVLTLDQIPKEYENGTQTSEEFSHLADLRDDPSIKFGERHLTVLSDNSSSASVLAVVRWKPGRQGYVGLFNPGANVAHVNLTEAPSIPASLAVYHVARDVRLATNYTHNAPVQADDVIVPGYSAVVLSYAPKTEVEE